MKHTLAKAIPFFVTCGGEAIGLNLQPVTFRRLIDITSALKGKELSDVLKDPSPLEVVTMAYYMLNKEDIKRLNEIELKLNDKSVEISTIQKLYYLITENNVQDGYINYTSLMQSINENIIASFPKQEEKKKTSMLSMKTKNLWKLKKSLIFSALIILILLIDFLRK